MKSKYRPLYLAVLGALMLGAPAATGHPGHPDHDFGNREDFPGEGVLAAD